MWNTFLVIDVMVGFVLGLSFELMRWGLG